MGNAVLEKYKDEIRAARVLAVYDEEDYEIYESGFTLDIDLADEIKRLQDIIDAQATTIRGIDPNGNNAVIREHAGLIAIAEKIGCKDEWQTAMLQLARELERVDKENAALKAQLAAQVDKVRVADLLEEMGRKGITGVQRWSMPLSGTGWQAFGNIVGDWSCEGAGKTLLAALEALKTGMEA